MSIKFECEVGRIRKKEKILKKYIAPDGYEYIAFSYKNKQILVALTFLNNYYNKEQVNHKNKIRNDNRLVNLEWNTRSENITHSQKNSKKSIIKKFSSINEASMKVFKNNKHVTTISKCCLNKQKSYGGYIWKYNLIDQIPPYIFIQEIPSFLDYFINKNGDVYSMKSKKLMKPYILKGYKRVNIRNNTFVGTKNIHNLMAETFLEIPTNIENLVVNHIDSDRSNNKLENLEYISAKNNKLESYYSENGKNKVYLKGCAQYDLQNNLINKFASLRL